MAEILVQLALKYKFSGNDRFFGGTFFKNFIRQNTIRILKVENSLDISIFDRH